MEPGRSKLPRGHEIGRSPTGRVAWVSGSHSLDFPDYWY